MNYHKKFDVRRSPYTPWIILGTILCTAMLALRYIAPQFAYEINVSDMPVLPMVITYCLVGFIFFLFAPRFINNTPASSAKNILTFVILLGIAMRALSLGVPAIIEDDFYRYLWDGAVTAAGENPFLYAPELILRNPEINSTINDLVAQAKETVGRINHPEYRTVYPPVAQAVFALAHFISPYSLDAWRIVLFFFELGTLCLILAILRELGRSPLWLSLYWWNPVVIKEISNSGHMEPILLLPVLGAAYLVLKSRHIWVAALLSIGAGVKVWPVILAAPVARQILAKPKLLLGCIIVFLSLFILFFWPILAAGLSKTSGFVGFGREWSASSAIYLASYYISDAVAPSFMTEMIPTPLLARGLLGVSLIGAIIYICFKSAADEKQILHHMFLVLAVMYLLLPSQTPWYFIWLAPFLCFFPTRGLLLATATLPLHYVFHHLYARDLEGYYHYGVVWVMWVPIWGLLAYDLIATYRDKRVKQGKNHATG